MIYRKSPVRPVRLLLRVVATASAAAVGLACSGEVLEQPTEPVGGGITCGDGLVGGSVAIPDYASVGGGLACADSGLCGSIAIPEDAGDDSGHVVVGTVPNFDDAGDDGGHILVGTSPFVDASTVGGGVVGVLPALPDES